MCLACGTQWPWGAHQVHVAPPPTKEETIYVDDTTQFYPDYRQGIHPPGPVYQTIGAAAPNMFAPGMYGAGMYPMQGMYPGMNGYGVPNMCNYQIPGFGAQQFMYPQTAASMMPGQVPGQYPFANSPADLSAQAAAAAEHNKSISSMPNAPPYMVGANSADFTTQQAILAQSMGMPQGMMPGAVPGMGMGMAMAGGGPNTLAPYKPGEANSFWCRETDGGWTLRGYSEISLGDVSPGHWEKHAISGYFFWVRHLS